MSGLPHILSVLIFGPLAAAAVAAAIRDERWLRGWTLASTTALAILSFFFFSFPSGF